MPSRAPSPPSTVPGSLAPALRLLADPTRLRILGLLELEELAVGELSRALGLSQSRVSNHLRVLRDAGLLRERHAGTSTFLRVAEPGGGQALFGRLWAALRAELDGLPEHAADRVRLERVVAARRARDGAFFDRLAGDWDTVAGTFATGQARLRLATQLLDRERTVADLGCGTGTMGLPLLGLVGRLICVDSSRGMLAEAERRLRPLAAGTRLEFREGSFDRLPLEDGEVDAALCGMVLHHLADLDASLVEAVRVLRPGGVLALLELEPHREAWMRAAQGDRHLGLDAQDVLAALARAGLDELALVPVEDAYRPRRPEAECGPDGRTVPSASADTNPPERTRDPNGLALYAVRGRKPTATDPRTLSR